MGKVSKVGGGPIGGESWIVPSGMVLKLPDGLVGTPSLTYTSDTDSGFYRIGSDEIGITLGGVLGYDFSNTSLTLGTSTVGKNLSAVATLGAEKITWTAAGWDEGGVEWTVAGTPIVITHATGNTTALTSTLASAIVANTTYKVVIIYTQVAGSCTYTLGGITGTSLNTTGATVTDYITTYDTTQMVITPLSTSNIVISSISIKALTDATGDVVIDGNLTVRSPFVSPILLSAGSASNPSFAFGLEATLGWYRPVAGTMGLAISSAERLRFSAVTSGGLLEILDAGGVGGYALSATIGTPDVFLARESAAVLQLGLDAAGVTNQMFKGPDRITSDGVGGNLTIAGGRNRGASVGGSIIFQTSPAAGGGVTGTLATALTIDSTKLATFAGAISTTNLTDSGLTITRVPFASTGGLLIDDADLTFATDTLSATKLISSTSITSPQIYGSSADSGTLTLTSTSHTTKGTVLLGRLTFSDLANADGIVFGNLGTATKAIDFSSSGLSGGDYLFYFSDNLYFACGGEVVMNQSGSSLKTRSVHTGDVSDLVIEGWSATAGLANLILGVGTYSNLFIGNKTKVLGRSQVTLPTANKDYINRAGIGTGLSTVGMVIQVIEGTGPTYGLYRITTLISANSIQVDRNIHNSGADITDAYVAIYKDAISVGATDATNGQMLTSWSAQNKPLQLGGTVLATTSGLTSKDVYFGGDIGTGGTVNTTTTNAYVVGGGQIATTKNTGWLQVYIGTVLSWVPYWSNATP